MTLRLPHLPPRLRLPATILGAVLLVGGSAWSVVRLNLTWSEVRTAPLLANLLVVQPMLLAVASFTLGLSARVLGTRIGFRHGLNTVSYAAFAETLPLPGGAMVRGAALMGSGASLGQAAGIVTLTAVLTLALLIALSAGALALLGTSEAWAVLALALAALAVTLGLIWQRAGTVLSLSVLGIRVVTAAIGAVSIYTALAALGQPAGLLEAVLLTVSASLGAAVAIVPAGVGISESIAAGLAALTTVAPEAAFLAVALHRALGLIASLCIIGLFRAAR